VPTWFEKKPKEKGSVLKESEAEVGRNQEETGVAPHKPDGFGRSAPTCMVCILPNEFMAPANQICAGRGIARYG
jgi:hypothetical protein